MWIYRQGTFISSFCCHISPTSNPHSSTRAMYKTGLQAYSCTIMHRTTHKTSQNRKTFSQITLQNCANGVLATRKNKSSRQTYFTTTDWCLHAGGLRTRGRQPACHPDRKICKRLRLKHIPIQPHCLYRQNRTVHSTGKPHH